MASVSSRPSNGLSAPESSTVPSPQQISAQRSIASPDAISPRIPAANTAQIIKLQHHLEGHRGQRFILVIQDFPDPDALSSAWAFQLIAAQYEIQCEIVYAGTLSHQENIALVKLTGLPAKRWGPQMLKDIDLSDYQGCVLVDSQGTNSQLMPLVQEADIPVVVIIDHHSQQEEVEAENAFVDIRPGSRSTATILTEYLQGGTLDFNSSNPTHVKCATALMHGLRSDTINLLQAQEAEFMAAAYLSRIYDAQLLNAVLQSARSKRVMEVIERSLQNRVVQNNFSLAGVGYLRYEERDAIPQAADFLATEENVHTALVYGIVHDRANDIELVIGSLRTNKLTLDPDEFLKDSLGMDGAGRYYGGGRDMAGGFEIPVGFLTGCNDQAEYTKLKWEVFDRQLKQKFFRLINPDHRVVHS
ncbi:bifunctional oligoribonuclease/PAP phosphatase NrnA [Synechocystis sp. FACHB-383]|uniref:DHH family phosphoesterase n=1 Tax=Synechocystis sp. FACHB-383 TaxID=2692864 RepID=UPI0016844518|nr:bifunctional oligoribonuclease/PAP phosphatase NrnA [Synechocystis sp. FACHB-383]MBD2652806.1 bifunctional oligoribonuclease/PAP phosphatase NrnA [Synechocystis sp. FACHB-383]